jgi:hypothetical protein
VRAALEGQVMFAAAGDLAEDLYERAHVHHSPRRRRVGPSRRWVVEPPPLSEQESAAVAGEQALPFDEKTSDAEQVAHVLAILNPDDPAASAHHGAWLAASITRMLELNWPRVDSLAHELLTHRTLSGVAVEQVLDDNKHWMIRRAVDR